MGETEQGALQTIERRSSTRAYTEELPTKEQLDALIRAGLQAPTATDRQEIHISVVSGNHPILAEIEAEKNRGFGVGSAARNFYYDAPIVLFLSAEEAFSWGKVDAGIAVENIALAAEALGLGSVIIGCVKSALRGEKRAYFDAALDFPAGYAFEIAIAVGHKATGKPPHTYSEEKSVSYL